MGLDMYLYAEKYVSNASDSMVERFPQYAKEREMYREVVKAIGGEMLPTPEYGGMSISKCVGYWRKANAIHGWFVRELADGIDECQRIDVGWDDITRLRDECINALANRNNAVPTEERTKTISMDDKSPEEMMNVIMEEWGNQKAKANSTVLETSDPLAPTAGFFFGGTEKDEYYYQDIEHTLDVLNSLLAFNDTEWSFYYRASW
jgi:hypothetical protein